ncbi:unnamed protein product, partial [Mesorhabditis spiculigera]
MTPMTPGKGRAVKRRWPTDDNPTDSEEEEHRQTTAVCKQCGNVICRSAPSHFALHSSTHLSFRSWKCSVCSFTAGLKGDVKGHLNKRHQGNGRVIDNRTAEYYDALEAKTKANFPGLSNAIAKYIGGQKRHWDFKMHQIMKMTIRKTVEKSSSARNAEIRLTQLVLRFWLSTRHRTFPSDPGICASTMTLKSHLQRHLHEVHPGNGRVIDNRTAEYFDALEAKTKANFPAHSNAIAKYIGGQKETLGFQDASDDEDDNPQDGRKIAVCKECSNAIHCDAPSHLTLHSSTHLSFRPWKCSVCTYTMNRKKNLQRHLNAQHQGNGWVIDNRTAEYYDALKAKAQANFPDRARAIAKFIGEQRHVSGIQARPDNEDDTPEDNPPIQCSNAVYRDAPCKLARHSSTHLSFRPWKCSVCDFTMARKDPLQQHLKEQHQGDGRAIDNRTAEYYDALEAKTKANFPDLSSAIAKYIGEQKKRLGFQDASDHEDDNPQDGRKISNCKVECRHSIVSTTTWFLAQHSLTHLAFRPWKCSVCTFTARLKGDVKSHLKTQHQGTGQVIDNRTAEYYDALESKMKANFPAHSSAIAKYIGRQMKTLGFQDASDHEDDNAQTRRKIFSCKECRHSIVATRTRHLAQHSVAHLAFRPWKCSVCDFTMARKGDLHKHLNEQHQGNGWVIDNRTAEYYDALKALTQTNFPGRAKAIAKHIGWQRHVSRIQDGSDDEDDTLEDNPPIVHLPAPGDKSLDIRQNVQTRPEAVSSKAGTIKQEVVPDTVPPRSKEKSTHRTMVNTQREVKQEPLDVENYSFDFDVVFDGSEADADADAHAPIRHHNEQNVRNGDKDQSSSPTLHPIVVKQELLDENPTEEPRRIDKKEKKKKKPVPQIDTDHSIDKRFEETIMTMKLGGAKISSDMARMRAAMRETKADVARLQTNMALLETLSERRNAENRRLRQENDRQAAQLKMLMEEIAALRDRIRNG